MRIGPNMQAYLLTIRSEPGQWTVKKLAEDYDVSLNSVRRSLRRLEEFGLIRHEKGSPPARGGRHELIYYPILDCPS